MKEKLEYNKYKDLENKYNSLVNKIASGRLIMFIVMIISFILSYYYYMLLFRVISLVSLVCFIV